MNADFNAPSYRGSYCFSTLADSDWSSVCCRAQSKKYSQHVSNHRLKLARGLRVRSSKFLIRLLALRRVEQFQYADQEVARDFLARFNLTLNQRLSERVDTFGRHTMLANCQNIWSLVIADLCLHHYDLRSGKSRRVCQPRPVSGTALLVEWISLL